MIDRDPETAVVFLHIPKTGGSTLHQLVHANYSSDSVYILGLDAPDGRIGKEDAFTDLHQRSIEWLKNSPSYKKQRIQCLMGHMPFGFHRYLPHGGQYVTLLRHPLDRVVSHYNYVKNTPGHYLHKQVDMRKISLCAYAEATESLELNNGQARLLADMEDSVPFGQCDQGMLNLAWKNIRNHFLYVGLQEYFEESIKGICKAADWDPVKIDSINVTEDKTEATDQKTIQRILEYNSLDLALFEAVRRGFCFFN